MPKGLRTVVTVPRRRLLYADKVAAHGVSGAELETSLESNPRPPALPGALTLLWPDSHAEAF